MDYGSGAVMAVPAHDQRDYEFAQKYQLPIEQVIAPSNDEDCNLDQQAFTNKGILVNSAEFDGLEFEQAFDAIAAALDDKNLGSVTTNFRLRDWGVSRTIGDHPSPCLTLEMAMISQCLLKSYRFCFA